MSSVPVASSNRPSCDEPKKEIQSLPSASRTILEGEAVAARRGVQGVRRLVQSEPLRLAHVRGVFLRALERRTGLSGLSTIVELVERQRAQRFVDHR